MYLRNLLTSALIITASSDYIIKNLGDIHFIYNRLPIKYMIDITTLYDNVEKYAITLENSEYACGNLSKSYDFATRMIEHCDYTLEKQREKIREMLDDIEYINTFKNHNKRNVFQEIWYQKEIYNLFWNMSDSIDDQLEREKKTRHIFRKNFKHIRE